MRRKLTDEQKKRILELARDPQYLHHEGDSCSYSKNCIHGRVNNDKIAREVGCADNSVKYCLYPEYRERTKNWRKDLLNSQIQLLSKFDENSKYTLEELSETTKKTPFVVSKILNSFEQHLGTNSPIKKTEDGLYILNQDSPYWIIADGYWNK